MDQLAVVSSAVRHSKCASCLQSSWDYGVLKYCSSWLCVFTSNKRRLIIFLFNEPWKEETMFSFFFKFGCPLCSLPTECVLFKVESNHNFFFPKRGCDRRELYQLSVSKIARCSKPPQIELISAAICDSTTQSDLTWQFFGYWLSSLLCLVAHRDNGDNYSTCLISQQTCWTELTEKQRAGKVFYPNPVQAATVSRWLRSKMTQWNPGRNTHMKWYQRQ